jgi:transposase
MLVIESLPVEVRLAYASLQAENARLTHIIKLQNEEIRLLNLQRWGPKADKLSENQLALLPLEISVSPAEIEREAALPEKEKALPRARAPRPNHPGRTVLPAHLERREVIIPCHPQDCRCLECGAERPVIGYEVREELGCQPAQFFVRVIKREKRGSHCLEEQGVVVAPAPLQIVPKGKLSNELIIEALAAKFQQYNPVYRQCASLLEDQGIDLSRQTLNDAILSAAELLIPVVQAQAAVLLAGSYLQADETTLPCQTEEKSGKNHCAYIWEYSAPGGLVVFQFAMGRGRISPAQFLRGFRGKVQCDGYGAYDELGPDITYVACMAHIRRKFVDAAKLSPQDPAPAAIAQQIGLLYKVEEQARIQKMDAAARLALRIEQSQPVMTALKTRILEVRQQVTPASALAKACDYALGQWSRMEEYLRDGQVEIDNNWCEGAMRPIALGRKNWLHAGHESAGPKLAAILSIIETCRRLDLPLRTYLGEILPKLGGWPITRVAELTPTAWKAARTS